ncbi:hypothetical protein A1351_14035 [Methylosinus sp. R-45379]|uniref:phage tail assembly chaperone n=1 Tax=Methylosinus sp. R-45379 TaxID=980563 RepID=UPI0007C8837D|nr:phage tail assembly chaperone [Methylosinus sp. R-45379]OAI26958.1 hypothetical protein A1351_14035 [Methylosinus sp. R-45379]
MPRLAEDKFEIPIGHETIILRPTLRAATRLERRFEGFSHILRGIAEQNITIMAAVIIEASVSRSDLLDLLERDERFPLGEKTANLVEPLISVVLALTGADECDVKNEPDEIEQEHISFADHHARLFRLATGWLGWTPETTWNATPAEIMEAYQGRLDMLKAIFGSSEESKKAKGVDSDEVAAFFSKLAARAA